MPVYLYKILETGETFEIEQRMTEPALKVHPETGQAVKRLIQPVGIAFKGSGFYVNDSRTETKKKAPKAITDGKVKSKAKSETKSETKTQAKAKKETANKKTKKTVAANK